MEQPQYNLLVRDKVEKEFEHLYPEIGLGLTIFSPLKNGVLTGKYNDGIPPDSRLATSKDNVVQAAKKNVGNEEWVKVLSIVKSLSGLKY